MSPEILKQLEPFWIINVPTNEFGVDMVFICRFAMKNGEKDYDIIPFRYDPAVLGNVVEVDWRDIQSATFKYELHEKIFPVADAEIDEQIEELTSDGKVGVDPMDLSKAYKEEIA